MTPIFLTWLLSLTGAGLFFAAGEVWGRQRKGHKEIGDLTTLGAELEATRAHMLEQERAKQELRAHESLLTGELSQRRSESDQLRDELTDARTLGEHLERELQTTRSELQKTRTSRPAPAPLGQAGADKNELDRELARVKHDYEFTNQQLKRAEIERDLLSQQLERAYSENQTAALQQELSLTRESLRARDTQLDHLREETVRLHRVEADLERAKREISELAEQTRLLRAEAYASHRPPTKRPERQVTISTRGNALQLIVDDETENGGARSAVIADELGLVVASSGVVSEYGDALAAFGAYLADVGTRTRDVLPLHEVRQVVVRDDHDMTLTVRPLATEDPGLALVTLAIDTNRAVPMQGRAT